MGHSNDFFLYLNVRFIATCYAYNHAAKNKRKKNGSLETYFVLNEKRKEKRFGIWIKDI